MSSSKPSRNNFWPVAAVTLTLSSIAAGISLSAGEGYAKTRAAVLADLSDQNKINPVVGYQAARVLDPRNDQYRLRLGERYLIAWEPQATLDSLRSQPDSTNTRVLRSKALMELNRGVESPQLSLESDSEAVQAILVRATYSKDGSALNVSDIKSEQGRELLTRVRDGGLPLAHALQQYGMPQSALRVLNDLSPSVAREQLVAQIELSRPNDQKTALAEARTTVDRGLAIDPSNVTLHELSREIYSRTGDSDNINRETDLINRLHSGTF